MIKDMRKKVIVTDKEDLGREEAWCRWWKCNNCKDEDNMNIMEGTNYCPVCGSKIVWKVKSP